MFLDRLSQWLTVIANLGVVAGFLLLAMQLNQTTTAIEKQNASESAKVGMNAELAAIGDTGYEAMARAMLRPAEMREEQILQLWYYLDNVLGGLYSLWIAYEAGQASESDWAEACRGYAYMLDFEAARIVWNRYKGGAFPAEFIEEFDEALEQRRSGSAGVSATFREIIDDIRRIPADGAVRVVPSGERSDA
jgi:hypothetical protein